MKRQSGLTLISTLLVGIFLVAVLLLGLKLVPVFNEYFSVKKALNSVVRDVPPDSGIGEFRKAFDRFAAIDDISSVRGQDLIINRAAGSVDISVEYERRVALVANASLVLAFDVSSNK
ncbi:MAG: DUF4845 domain-containing protein [Moraxellaceae bacterium]|nr:DUF4845 domain-containing protein [Moraxellaceae bacterium]